MSPMPPENPGPPHILLGVPYLAREAPWHPGSFCCVHDFMHTLHPKLISLQRRALGIC